MNDNQNNQNFQKEGNVGYAILGFCIPLVGLILFLIWKDEKPKDAKYAGVGALISVIAGVVLYAIAFAFGLLNSFSAF
jgi:multisubunit Na+/H+ antiporter MnhB subunit